MNLYLEVLEAAQKLPVDNQMELAETLLRNVHARQEMPADSADTELVPLSNMSEAELQVLARAMLAPAHQQKLQVLLEKNRTGDLSAQEEKELATLLEEVDQLALLKARALYTLECRK